MTDTRAYVAFTPYHLVLALALQVRDGHPPATLLFADEAGFLAQAPEVAMAVNDHLDLHVAPALESIPMWEYPMRLRWAASHAQRVLTRNGIPSEIFFSNGLRPESQRLFSALRPDDVQLCRGWARLVLRIGSGARESLVPGDVSPLQWLSSSSRSRHARVCGLRQRAGNRPGTL